MGAAWLYTGERHLRIDFVKRTVKTGATRKCADARIHGTIHMTMHNLRDVGGTKGGLIHFFVGLIMTAVGGYLLLNAVTVHGGYWNFGGSAGTSFGISMVPLLFGIAMLFYNGKSAIGWLLTGAGALVIFSGIIANMSIHFMSTSLFATLTMLVLLVGGLGLIFRSLRAVG